MSSTDVQPGPSSIARLGTGVLGQRLIVVAGIRAVLAIALSVFLATAGSDLLDPAGVPLAIVTGIVVVVFSLLVPVCSVRTARVVLDLSVVIDAAALAILLHVTGGAGSPFGPLVVLAVALHLLACGVRTGLRVAVATSLGLGWVWAVGPISDASNGPTGVIGGLGGLTTDTRILVTLFAIWVAVASMALLTRVVERDLRRAVADRDHVRQVGRAMDPDKGPRGVAEQLVHALDRVMGLDRSSVWLHDATTDTLVLTAASVALDGDADDPVVLPPAGAVAEAIETGKLTAGRPHGPLARLHYGNLVMCRLQAPGADLAGVLVIGLPEGRWRQWLRGHLSLSLAEIAHDAGVALDEARQFRALQQQARTDPVTGIPNHRAFQERLAVEIGRARRRWAKGEPAALSVALFDLDHFKQVNDRHGHPTGDAVLEAVAQAVDRGRRAADLVCRYGGEEFALVLADTNADEARLACERFRRLIASVVALGPSGQPIRVTASFGVASATGPDTDRDQLVDAADGALYQAKGGGRNRVECADVLTAP